MILKNIVRIFSMKKKKNFLNKNFNFIEMNIIDIHDFKASNISLEQKNESLVEIFYNKEPFCLQSPLCIIEEINFDQKHNLKYIIASCYIKNNFTFLKILNLIDLRINKYIDENNIVSSSYNPGHEEVDSSKGIKIKIKLKKSGNAKFFDMNKKEISEYDFKLNDKVIFIFFTKGIFHDQQAINYRWSFNEILKI